MRIGAMQAILVVGIPGLCVLLGFIALLTQKIYKAEDGGATTVELPLFGKLQTNYPALVFVFLGLGSSVLLYNIMFKQSVQWVIDGQIVAPSGVSLDGSTIQIYPSSYSVNGPNAKGKFVISLELPSDKTIENAVQYFEVETSDKLFKVFPSSEFEKKKSGQDSLLKFTTDTSRSYSIEYGN